MDAIKIDRMKLLDIVRENRSKHVMEYEEARRGYLQTAKEWFEGGAALADNGDLTFETHFTAQRPENHKTEYDRVIRMLELAERQDTIELGEHDFARYVMDEWEWTLRFKAVNSSYMVGR